MDGNLDILIPDQPYDLDYSQPPMIFDSFAGGGGASTGIEMALGRSPDVAVNHDAVALTMHEANHPDTHHLTANVWHVNPDDVVPPGRKVGLAWFSPDCKHHSKAKGGKPVKRNIRDLAWVVVLWTKNKRTRPDVIMLENVEEFQDWGPLTDDDKPDKTRKGETFKKWTKQIESNGYKVEWRELRACDYGAPTIRKRLFLIARCDGRPIVWPEPTHGAPDSLEVRSGMLKPWRTAAEIIDWSLPCPSIFDTSEQIMEKHGLRAIRPLADATLRRIARGVQRYVIDAAKPFIIRTDMHSAAMRNGVHGDNEPVRTLTTRGGFAVVAPTLVQTGYGERKGQAPRSLDLDKPIGTMVAGGTKHALVAAFLAQHNAGERMKNGAGRPAGAPLSTITTRGTQQTIIAANLTYAQQGGANRPIDAPHHTITASKKDQNCVVASTMVNLRGTADGQLVGRDVNSPVPTISAGGGHAALVSAFLMKYYGTGEGQSPDNPMHTVTSKDRFGLVTVEIDGKTYAITDIGMRMLTPREQFRAQGFPDDYDITTGPDGRNLTKTEQTRMCGNSAPPDVVDALVGANCGHMAEVVA